MAVGGDLVLWQRQPLTERDAQLPLHEVEPGDHLGDRMLDLQARVHLDEMETCRVGDELDCAGIDVVDRLRGGAGGRADLGPALGREADGGRLLHHLLVAALQRAFALEQRHHVTVDVAEHLHLDMARLGEVLLDQEPVVAERCGDSRCAPATASASSPGLPTTRMPLPPPPAEALTSTG